MYYSKINKIDIANGPGCRVSIFVSGCRNACMGCFNKETWDFRHGDLFTTETMNTLKEALQKDFIKGITILGGEPLEPENRGKVKEIIDMTNGLGKTVWLFTGFSWEILWVRAQADELLKSILTSVDVVVDGRFIEEQIDISLAFRGSRNQRIIDAKKSASMGLAVDISDTFDRVPDTLR